jgi:hypothetical protein
MRRSPRKKPSESGRVIRVTAPLSCSLEETVSKTARDYPNRIAALGKVSLVLSGLANRVKLSKLHSVEFADYGASCLRSKPYNSC